MGHFSFLLIGHYLLNKTKLANGRKVRDVSQSRKHLAIVAAENARLAHCVSAPYTASDDVNLVSDLWKTDASTISIEPDIVVLSLGSNDLAQMQAVDRDMVESLCAIIIHFAQELLTKYGVKSVIINSIVPRTHRISSTPAAFLANMEHFNSIISQWCDKNDNATYNHLRGFYAHYEKDNIQSPLPVSHWSNDGIHGQILTATPLCHLGHCQIPVWGNLMIFEVSYSLMSQPFAFCFLPYN